MILLKEAYETLIHLVKDFRSTRERLIVVATALFIFSVYKNVDVITLGIMAGLLVSVYGFYFHSKSQEHNQNNRIEIQAGDPPSDTDREP